MLEISGALSDSTGGALVQVWMPEHCAGAHLQILHFFRLLNFPTSHVQTARLFLAHRASLSASVELAICSPCIVVYLFDIVSRPT